MADEAPSSTAGVPTVSAIIRGKRCYDPRTGVTAWTENPALHVRDLAVDPLGGRLPPRWQRAAESGMPTELPPIILTEDEIRSITGAVAPTVQFNELKRLDLPGRAAVLIES